MHERRKGDSSAFVFEYLRRAAAVLDKVSIDEAAQLIDLLRDARERDRSLFICGNGGSAATASHFAAGLGKEGSVGRPQRFRAVALTDNMAWITSLANDLDYSRVFVEQLMNHARAGDLLIAFSGSGNSSNVLQAVEWANQNGLTTIGVTSRPGGSLAEAAQHTLCIDSNHIGHVEEAHFIVQHLITYYFAEGEG
jgi:D-sedoheptulose 7-phosphate isomerase